jgi:hypothetical protein
VSREGKLKVEDPPFLWRVEDPPLVWRTVLGKLLHVVLFQIKNCSERFANIKKNAIVQPQRHQGTKIII